MVFDNQELGCWQCRKVARFTRIDVDEQTMTYKRQTVIWTGNIPFNSDMIYNQLKPGVREHTERMANEPKSRLVDSHFWKALFITSDHYSYKKTDKWITEKSIKEDQEVYNVWKKASQEWDHAEGERLKELRMYYKKFLQYWAYLYSLRMKGPRPQPFIRALSNPYGNFVLYSRGWTDRDEHEYIKALGLIASRYTETWDSRIMTVAPIGDHDIDPVTPELDEYETTEGSTTPDSERDRSLTPAAGCDLVAESSPQPREPLE